MQRNIFVRDGATNCRIRCRQDTIARIALSWIRSRSATKLAVRRLIRGVEAVYILWVVETAIALWRWERLYVGERLLVGENVR